MHSEGVVPTCAADGGTEHGCEVLLPTPVYLATSGEPGIDRGDNKVRVRPQIQKSHWCEPRSVTGLSWWRCASSRIAQRAHVAEHHAKRKEGAQRTGD